MMPDLPYKLLRSRQNKLLSVGLGGLVLLALGVAVFHFSGGAFFGSGVQSSSSAVSAAGGEIPPGFVPVQVAGVPLLQVEPGDLVRIEPGWDIRGLLEVRRELGLKEAGLLAVEEDTEPLVEAVWEAEALRETAQAEQSAALKEAARRDRLARLQERLDTTRSRQREEDRKSPGEHKGVVASGESVSVLLQEYLTPAEVEAMARACKDVFPLHQIRAGHSYAVTVWDGKLKRFEYDIDRERKLVVHATETGFEVGEKQLEFETFTARLAGTITLSLFGAVERMGERGDLAMRLADIFGWEIDFIRDIRVGDSFKVLVEKRMHKDKLLGYGSILAAEFVNQGVRYQGFLFHDANGIPGYYTADGDSLRKAFLKAPLEFTRISSDFTWKRLHPILKTHRPHPGIDYAAPTGTPVKTVGNGTVTFTGWTNGGGNTIKIRHMNGYETVYMHLSRYSKGLSKGKKVQQGEVVGFVGSTGLSTGPHLDYRMLKDGKYINPHKVVNPKAASLPKELLRAFNDRVRQLSVHLENERFQPVRDFALDAELPDMAMR